MKRDSLEMTQIILIGIGAGTATALLFASLASGALLSVVLFYLAPLPIMIAALGWSHWSGLIGAFSASAGLALVFGSSFFLTFLIGIGAPAWWLGYLALLARPAAASNDVEWYPAGRLVLWSAIIGALVVVAAIAHFGFDQQRFQAALRHAFEQLLELQPDTGAGKDATDRTRIVDVLVLVVPPAAAVVWTILLTLNLWLAGTTVRISGRLKRPWPNISAMTFPTLTPALMVGTVMGSLLPDLAGLVSAIFAASLLMAYALLGFAVLHAITSNVKGRRVMLAGTYGAVIVLGWPVLIMSLLGLADTALGLRVRLDMKRGPPPIPDP
jgi:hypothetical protein